MLPIFLDIETLPDLRPGAKDAFLEAAADNFKAPSTLTKEQAAKDLGITDPEKIKFTSKEKMVADWADHFKAEKAIEFAEAAWRKTSFDGGQGQILMIGVACEDGEPVVFHDDCERYVLSDFYDWLANRWTEANMTLPTFVGHNVVDFDLRFIFQRSTILGVKPPSILPTNPSPWADSVFDTMTRWAGRGNRISLDALCRIFGIKGKDGIDGSMVYDMLIAGKRDELVAYCANDVHITREVWRRMSFQAEAIN